MKTKCARFEECLKRAREENPNLNEEEEEPLDCRSCDHYEPDPDYIYDLMRERELEKKPIVG